MGSIYLNSFQKRTSYPRYGPKEGCLENSPPPWESTSSHGLWKVRSKFCCSLRFQGAFGEDTRGEGILHIRGNRLLPDGVFNFILVPLSLPVARPDSHPNLRHTTPNGLGHPPSTNLPPANLSIQLLLLIFADPPKPKVSSQLPPAISLSTFSLTTQRPGMGSSHFPA